MSGRCRSRPRTSSHASIVGAPPPSGGAAGSIRPVDVLRVGFDGYSGDAFRGDLDDVRVYNRALTAEEIGAAMSR